MISFLLTNWWIYVPIVAFLVFLTYRNNQKIKNIKKERELRKLTPEERQKRLKELKRKSTAFDSTIEKYGLRGVLSHIFPKK
jgi:hypothetical protein